MAKKVKLASSQNWSNIHDDLFDLVLTRLSFNDRLQLRGVCTSWRSMVKTHFSNVLRSSPLYRSPLLMQPNNKKVSRFDDGSLFGIKDIYLEKIKSTPKETWQSVCIGSSHGWLLFFDANQEKYLCFNPFSDICISICSLPKLPFITAKVILSSDPILSGGTCAIVALDESQSRIAFGMCGDSKWSYFNCKNFPYFDIICHKDSVFALAESCSVDIWGFSTSGPVQSFSINPPFRQECIYGPNRSLKKHYDVKLYLVFSKDELLMVVRYIVEFPPPYWTKRFDVYKLGKEGNWVKKDDLGDMLLILGANHSVSKAAGDLEGYKKNMIYFTDDNRRLMKASRKVASKDIGVYSLGIDCSDRIKISPSIRTMFWVVP